MKTTIYSIMILAALSLQSCIPALIIKSMKEQKKIEEQSIEILNNHNLTHLYYTHSQYSESSIYAQDQTELIFMRRIDIPKYFHNDENNVGHDFTRIYQVSFLELNQRIEIEAWSAYNVIFALNENQIFELGGLNSNAVQNMVKKYGRYPINVW